MRILAPLLLALCLAAPAWASELAVTVTNPAGKPIQDAVVMVRPQGMSHEPFRFSWPNRMAQKDLQFDPFVLVAPVGSEVVFPNFDPVKHHVYSFSPAKTFELKLYGRDQTRSVKFDKPGVVAIGCNIHDDMTAFIRVVDTPFAIKTGANGVVTLHGLPPGPAQMIVWHPYMKARGGEVVRDLVIPASGTLRLAVTGELRAPRMMHGGY
jgi:hypothetical protein